VTSYRVVLEALALVVGVDECLGVDRANGSQHSYVGDVRVKSHGTGSLGVNNESVPRKLCVASNPVLYKSLPLPVDELLSGERKRKFSGTDAGCYNFSIHLPSEVLARVRVAVLPDTFADPRVADGIAKVLPRFAKLLVALCLLRLLLRNLSGVAGASAGAVGGVSVQIAIRICSCVSPQRFQKRVRTFSFSLPLAASRASATIKSTTGMLRCKRFSEALS
jgi:hypothetical protein